MKRLHALALSLLAAVAVAGAAFAVVQIVSADAPAQASPDPALAAEQARLDRLEQRLTGALADLPGSQDATATAAAPAPPNRLVVATGEALDDPEHDDDDDRSEHETEKDEGAEHEPAGDWEDDR